MIEEILHTKETGYYDVVVCGGGIAGISAAVAAARHGAKVLLLEREYALGGLATLGLVTIYLPLCDGTGRQVCLRARGRIASSLDIQRDRGSLLPRMARVGKRGGTEKDSFSSTI